MNADQIISHDIFKRILSSDSDKAINVHFTTRQSIALRKGSYLYEYIYAAGHQTVTPKNMREEKERKKTLPNLKVEIGEEVFGLF